MDRLQAIILGDKMNLKKQIEQALEQIVKFAPMTKMSDDTEKDQQLFHQIMKTVVDEKYLSSVEISETFSVSIPTVERWTNGRTGPHPFMREGIYKTLLQKIFKKGI